MLCLRIDWKALLVQIHDDDDDDDDDVVVKGDTDDNILSCPVESGRRQCEPMDICSSTLKRCVKY